MTGRREERREGFTRAEGWTVRMNAVGEICSLEVMVNGTKVFSFSGRVEGELVRPIRSDVA